jgi:hypothetical protein
VALAPLRAVASPVFWRSGALKLPRLPPQPASPNAASAARKELALRRNEGRRDVFRAGLQQGIEPFPKSRDGERNVDAFVGCLENDESGLFAVLHLLDQFVFHDYFRHAAGRKAADEIRASDIGIVEIQSKAPTEEEAQGEQ